MARPPRSVWLVSLATAFSLLGDQTLYVVLPTYYESLLLKPWQVGVLLSANRWVRLFTNHLAERLLDRHGRTVLLALALGLGAATTAVYGSTSLFGLLLVARLLWGLCWSFIRQSGMMTAADSSDPRHIGQTMGYYNGLSRLGSLAGNLLGGIGHDLLGYVQTLLLFSGISLLGVPLGIASQRGVKTKPHPPELANQPRREMIGLWICGFIIGAVGSGMMMSALGVVLKERVGESITMMGIVIGVATLNGVLLSVRWIADGLGAPLFGALSDRLGRRRAALLFFGIGAFALFANTLASRPSVLVVGVVIFFICGTSVTVTLSAEAAHRGPRATAFYVTATDMGSASGPLLAWTTQQFALSTGWIFLLGGSFYAIGAIASRRTLQGNLNVGTNGTPPA